MNRINAPICAQVAVLLLTLLRAETCRTEEPRSAVKDRDSSAYVERSLVAFTDKRSGRVVLLDRKELSIVQIVEPHRPGDADGPMPLAEDAVRRLFYVGNFNGGVGRIAMDGRAPQTLDLEGVSIGVSISPDGKFLAAIGAEDQTLRLIDLDEWRIASKTRFGSPDSTPRVVSQKQELVSTRPVWMADGAVVLVQDSVHKDVVAIGRDGKEIARRRLAAAAHTFIPTPTGEILALVEGTIDRVILPSVVVLENPSLRVVREIAVPLQSDEPAKLHGGSLSPDGEIVVVANMGPMLGKAYGSTVAAVRWKTGEVVWRTSTVRNAGHVRFLDAERVIVLGHKSAQLPVLDARTGETVEEWLADGARALGHAISLEPDGTILVIEPGVGRLLRLDRTGVLKRSSAFDAGVSEASLPE